MSDLEKAKEWAGGHTFPLPSERIAVQKCLAELEIAQALLERHLTRDPCDWETVHYCDCHDRLKALELEALLS